MYTYLFRTEVTGNSDGVFHMQLRRDFGSLVQYRLAWPNSATDPIGPKSMTKSESVMNAGRYS